MHRTRNTPTPDKMLLHNQRYPRVFNARFLVRYMIYGRPTSRGSRACKASTTQLSNALTYEATAFKNWRRGLCIGEDRVINVRAGAATSTLPSFFFIITQG